jgi:hypothetical protein
VLVVGMIVFDCKVKIKNREKIETTKPPTEGFWFAVTEFMSCDNTCRTCRKTCRQDGYNDGYGSYSIPYPEKERKHNQRDKKAMQMDNDVMTNPFLFGIMNCG